MLPVSNLSVGGLRFRRLLVGNLLVGRLRPGVLVSVCVVSGWWSVSGLGFGFGLVKVVCGVLCWVVGWSMLGTCRRGAGGGPGRAVAVTVTADRLVPAGAAVVVDWWQESAAPVVDAAAVAADLAELRASFDALSDVLFTPDGWERPLQLSAGFRRWLGERGADHRAVIAEAVIATGLAGNGRDVFGHERACLPDGVIALAERVACYSGGRVGRDRGIEALCASGEIPPVVLRSLDDDSLIRLGADPQSVRRPGCQPLPLVGAPAGLLAAYRDELMADWCAMEAEIDRLSDVLASLGGVLDDGRGPGWWLGFAGVNGLRRLLDQSREG